eukprot:m.97504 g.97504  ORF g.97504 m.97504 type:complete len:582 (+) comp13980_c0_seq2:182-1927(+)
MDPLVLAQTGDVFSMFHQLHCGIPDRYHPVDGTTDQCPRTSSAPKRPTRRSRLSEAASTSTVPEEEESGVFDSPGRLPAEIWEFIFSFLPLQTLAATAQTCRFFSRLRWPLVVVDRLGPRLDDAALRAIVAHRPEELRLAHCPRLSEHAAGILISCSTIRRLRLQGVALTPAGIEHVARGFFSHYNRVRECVLRSCKLDDVALMVIADALRDVSHTPASPLTHLSLTNNNFTAVGLAQILDALGPDITSLNISGNNLGSQGGSVIGRFLTTNTTLKTLVMENIELGPDGLEFVSMALRLNKSIKELRLAENGLDALAMEGFARALEDNTVLEVVDLHANAIESQGTQTLARALRVNRSVKVLDLSDNRIGQNGARALGHMLETNTTLHTLLLRFNGFAHHGASAIAAGLRTNRSVRVLDLSFCVVTDSGAIALAQMLEANPVLVELILKDSDIGNNGATRLGLALTDNKTLRRLVLSGNRISDAGATGLAQGLLFNVGLHTLLLQGSHKGTIGPDGARHLASSLRRSSLTLVHLEDNGLTAEHAALFSGLPLTCVVHVTRHVVRQQVTWPKKKKHWFWRLF